MTKIQISEIKQQEKSSWIAAQNNNNNNDAKFGYSKYVGWCVTCGQWCNFSAGLANSGQAIAWPSLHPLKAQQPELLSLGVAPCYSEVGLQCNSASHPSNQDHQHRDMTRWMDEHRAVHEYWSNSPRCVLAFYFACTNDVGGGKYYLRVGLSDVIRPLSIRD